MQAKAEQERRKRQIANPTRRTGKWYEFRGNNQTFQNLTDSEIILSGPAETGKTIAGLYRLHQIALHHPIQAAIVRKVYADIHGSVLQTFQKKIIAGAPVRIYGGEKAQWYDYPKSGARIWVVGMDNPGKALSAEFDIIYFNQAEEAELEDWETLGTRTTGRAGNLPFSALWGDCNPRNQGHWILQRAQKGALKLLTTTHKDNPALWNDDKQEWTEQGKKTMSRLSSLTGVRLLRLFQGLWVTPEGTIYAEFDRNIHVKHRNPGEFQYWLLALDAGFDHPAVILLIGVDADLRLHVAREFCESGVLPSKHANKTLQWSHQHHAKIAVVDPSAAGLIAELNNVGVKAVSSDIRDVERGIDLIHELLAVQADKKPRLTIDPSCVNIVNEFESYRKVKGRIVKLTDDCLDALRYLATWLLGDEMESQEVVYDRVEIGRW